MWPQLFGPGWEFGVLVAGAILAGFGCTVWFAIRYPRSWKPDPVSDLWRRDEQGDLTSWEAARLFRLLPGQRSGGRASRAAVRRHAAFNAGVKLS